ncbi:hypothetical protein [Microbispora bryophytorum]
MFRKSAPGVVAASAAIALLSVCGAGPGTPGGQAGEVEMFD